MVFNSIQFLIFFLVTYGLYRCLGHRWQNRMLLAASYVFYGSWDWRFLFLLWLSTAIDYFCGRKISKCKDYTHKRKWLILSLAVNLLILGFFKYFNFFADSLRGLMGIWGIEVHPWTLTIILPVGISFYTFQSISYILDVYNGRLKPEGKFMNYALFVAFFPQLVAGPIERAGHMLDQFKTPRVLTGQKDREGVWFIAWGFFLKVFMADNLAKLAEIVFNQTGTIPGIEVLLGSYAFAFQIFGDFAGYSFIAMGVARLLGFDLMINFLYPYFVTNPSEFWRNWHISLSTWLRDYLYIPLGGNKSGLAQTCRNLFLTMFLGGLWHGAGWTFVIWGVYQGVLLIGHRLYRTFIPAPEKQSVPIRMLKILMMFQLTALGWMFFRAVSVGQIMDLTRSLFTNMSTASGKTFYLAAQIVFYTWLTVVIMAVQKNRNDLLAVPRLKGFLPWIFYLLMFYLLVIWGEYGGKQFIYFQF